MTVAADGGSQMPASRKTAVIIWIIFVRSLLVRKAFWSWRMPFMNQTARVLLSAEQLRFSIAAPDGPLDILHDISLSVARREALAMVADSGSGKITRHGLLAGQDRPTRGRVKPCGRELIAMEENERARLSRGKVGYVFQYLQLLPSLTALDNVMLALEVAGIK